MRDHDQWSCDKARGGYVTGLGVSTDERSGRPYLDGYGPFRIDVLSF